MVAAVKVADQVKLEPLLTNLGKVKRKEVDDLSKKEEAKELHIVVKELRQGILMLRKIFDID